MLGILVAPCLGFGADGDEDDHHAEDEAWCGEHDFDSCGDCLGSASCTEDCLRNDGPDDVPCDPQHDEDDHDWSGNNHYMCEKPLTKPAPTSAPSCEAGWKTYEGKCYKFGSERITWHSANWQCTKQGAHLAIINSKAENDWVTSHSNFHHIWIGSTDKANEGNFVDHNGEPLTYTNFSPGEPNNFFNNEDCIHIYAHDGKWNDMGCEEAWHTDCAISCSVHDNIVHVTHDTSSAHTHHRCWVAGPSADVLECGCACL
jgi:hypothetical protein